MWFKRPIALGKPTELTSQGFEVRQWFWSHSKERLDGSPVTYLQIKIK